MVHMILFTNHLPTLLANHLMNFVYRLPTDIDCLHISHSFSCDCFHINMFTHCSHIVHTLFTHCPHIVHTLSIREESVVEGEQSWNQQAVISNDSEIGDNTITKKKQNALQAESVMINQGHDVRKVWYEIWLLGIFRDCLTVLSLRGVGRISAFAEIHSLLLFICFGFYTITSNGI